ncbi:MAG: DUF134 domain-containing protein [Desulfobacterales bacterium]|nr:DUF134 domain-containing protein [Desulfobacterales bacterium]
MSRPRICCKVDAVPGITYFKPRGLPLLELTEVYLSFEGYEALRLADVEGLKHEEAAERMHVSRQTFGRVLSQARQAVATAVTSGQALRIEGGNYIVKESNDDALSEDSVNHGESEKPHQHNKIKSEGDYKMEKIAVSSTGPTLDSQIDERFGRAAGFIIVDPETMDFEYIDNGETQVMSQGAGINAAEVVARSGAKIVLTGYVGPKAFQALNAAKIEMGQDLHNMSVREAVALYLEGKVGIASQPNKTGHWK